MQRKLYELRENPLSIAIYGENEDVADLVESIKKDGILTALIVKPDGTIISGHRRYRAARKAGLITVPVEEKTPKDKLEEERWIISANKQRVKTASQLLREAERLEEVFAAMGREQKSKGRAQAWQEYREKVVLSNLDKTIKEQSPIPTFSEISVTEVTEKVTEKVTEPEPTTVPDMEKKEEPKPPEKKVEPVRTRELVAKELNMSPSSYNRLKTIGDAAKAGVPEAKEALRQLDSNVITLHAANAMVQRAIRPELAEVEKTKPDRVDKLLTALTSSHQWVQGVIDDMKRDEPETSTTDAKHIITAVMSHIRLLNIMKEALFQYIEDEEEGR